MGISFYIVGILYIIDNLHTLYKTFLVKKKDDTLQLMEDSIPKDFNDINFGELSENIDVLKKKNKENFKKGTWLIPIVFFVWIIGGIYLSEYSHLFVALLIINIVGIFLPFIMGAFQMARILKDKKDMLSALSEQAKEVKNISFTFMTTTECLLRISIVSYIIINHFNLI